MKIFNCSKEEAEAPVNYSKYGIPETPVKEHKESSTKQKNTTAVVAAIMVFILLNIIDIYQKTDIVKYTIGFFAAFFSWQISQLLKSKINIYTDSAFLLWLWFVTRYIIPIVSLLYALLAHTTLNK